MKNKGRAYTRYQKCRTINRKFNILRNIWGTERTEDTYDYKSKGKLSKGKIHCSCHMCQIKSHIELSKVDKSKLSNDLQSLKEYFMEY